MHSIIIDTTRALVATITITKIRVMTRTGADMADPAEPMVLAMITSLCIWVCYRLIIGASDSDLVA
jgi:hypothetical protein